MPTGGNGFGIILAASKNRCSLEIHEMVIEDEKAALPLLAPVIFLSPKQMAQSELPFRIWKKPSEKDQHDAFSMVTAIVSPT